MKFLNAGLDGCAKPAILNPANGRAVFLQEAGLKYGTLEVLARLAAPAELEELKRWLSEHPEAGTPLCDLALFPMKTTLRKMSGSSSHSGKTRTRFRPTIIKRPPLPPVAAAASRPIPAM